jgi:hypothetical protein
MSELEVTTYGPGGFDAAHPGGNVIERRREAISTEDANRDRIMARIAQSLEALESADAAWETLTAAQRTAAMRLAVRTSAKLARLTLGRLEKE